MLKRCCLAVLSLCAVAMAQNTPTTLPSGKAILDKGIEAAGGRAAFEKVQSRITRTKIEIPAMGMTGKTTIWQTAPAEARSVTEIEGIGKIEQGIHNGVVWEMSQVMGPRLLSDQEKDALVQSLTLNADLDYGKYYDKIETTGIQDVDGKPAYKVSMHAKNGNDETRYFDKDSGLMIKSEMKLHAQSGEMPASGTASDYQSVDGILMPFKTQQHIPQADITTTIEKIEQNTPIPPGTFDLPAEVKALVDKPATAPAAN